MTRTVLADFARSFLTFSFENRQIELVGSYIYCLPDRAPETTGLKVIHPGWWLGTLQKSRFTPSHALAMAIRADQATQIVPLQLGNQNQSAYLVGESFVYAVVDNLWRQNITLAAVLTNAVINNDCVVD